MIDPGLHNRNAGPDFFNAKMKIGGMMWVGNVELHSRSSEWYQHGHDSDKAYDNVVLHVVEQADTEVVTSSGRTLPQMVVEIPENVVANYRQLTAAESRPPCHDTVASIPALRLHSWLSALQMERLEQKTTAIEGLLKTYGGSWDDVFFCTLARSFGFGVNSEAFETWARTIPLMQVGHHRDDIFQVEAFFLGQAGLLSPDSLPRSHRQEAVRDGHFLRLQREYSYLAHKFSLSPMNGHQWRFMRLRPQNFPYIRLSQLAWMYWKQDARLSNVLAAASIDELHRLLRADIGGTADTQRRGAHNVRLRSPQARREALRQGFRPARTAAGRAQPHRQAMGRVWCEGIPRGRHAGSAATADTLLRPQGLPQMPDRLRIPQGSKPEIA